MSALNIVETDLPDTFAYSPPTRKASRTERSQSE
jgi:hypothetical protein